jgi:hypothetical protein
MLNVDWAVGDLQCKQQARFSCMSTWASPPPLVVERSAVPVLLCEGPSDRINADCFLFLFVCAGITIIIFFFKFIFVYLGIA